jgi:hypothetical protein
MLRMSGVCETSRRDPTMQGRWQVKDDELQRVNAALSKLQVEVVRAVIVERGAKAAWDHYVATYEPDASGRR